MKSPTEYQPSVKELIWLISESPRGGSVWNHFYQGRATAREIAKVIWAGSDPDVSVSIAGTTISPTVWITNLLNDEIRSRKTPNLKKVGNEYYALDTIRVDRGGVYDRIGNFASGKPLSRPNGLPFWDGVN